MKLPEGWRKVKLKYLFDLIGSGTTPDSKRAEYFDGGVAWVNSSELREDVVARPTKFVSSEALRDHPTLRIYPEGSLVVAMYGATMARLGLLGIPATVNQACCVFSQPRGVNTRFAFYAVLAGRESLLAAAEGGGQPNLNRDHIANVQIPVPDYATQDRVVRFLDSQTREIDDLIAKKQRLIDLLEEKRAALISRAVTQGLDPSVPMKDSGVEWLGRVPAHWSIAPVYSRFAVQLGKMLDARQITGEHLAPYLRNVDVQWDRINIENLPTMDFDPRDRKKFLLQSGDLLICEGGESGRAAIWSGGLAECYYQKALHRLRPTQGDVPRFMLYALRNAAVTGAFVAGSNQSTIDHLTSEKLRCHRFAFPSVPEQRAIVAHLDEAVPRVRSAEQTLEWTIRRLREYRSALITAAVTGQLDLRKHEKKMEVLVSCPSDFDTMQNRRRDESRRGPQECVRHEQPRDGLLV